ncbi:hypothetical protein F5Y15DRAFT_429336 [Xylariaceae sp. FL0016]|nr:hypothetical protein F5Y15DRAFT_429336 [Xylariaceae sp. FL0016]
MGQPSQLIRLPLTISRCGPLPPSVSYQTVHAVKTVASTTLIDEPMTLATQQHPQAYSYAKPGKHTASIRLPDTSRQSQRQLQLNLGRELCVKPKLSGIPEEQASQPDVPQDDTHLPTTLAAVSALPEPDRTHRACLDTTDGEVARGHGAIQKPKAQPKPELETKPQPKLKSILKKTTTRNPPHIAQPEMARVPSKGHELKTGKDHKQLEASDIGKGKVAAKETKSHAVEERRINLDKDTKPGVSNPQRIVPVGYPDEVFEFSCEEEWVRYPPPWLTGEANVVLNETRAYEGNADKGKEASGNGKKPVDHHHSRPIQPSRLPGQVIASGSDDEDCKDARQHGESDDNLQAIDIFGSENKGARHHAGQHIAHKKHGHAKHDQYGHAIHNHHGHDIHNHHGHGAQHHTTRKHPLKRLGPTEANAALDIYAIKPQVLRRIQDTLRGQDTHRRAQPSSKPLVFTKVPVPTREQVQGHSPNTSYLTKGLEDLEQNPPCGREKRRQKIYLEFQAKNTQAGKDSVRRSVEHAHKSDFAGYKKPGVIVPPFEYDEWWEWANRPIY